MIFVDTGAWFAAFVVNDADHATASRWLGQNRHTLITTDYVVDELLTLCRVRGERETGERLGLRLFTRQIARLIYVTERDITTAWETYRKYDDKDWSFTDCTSRAVMSRLEVRTAFSFDQHFRQFGTVSVVPDVPAAS